MPRPRVDTITSKRGAIPRIACINRTSVKLGIDFDVLIAALQKYVDEYLAPVWATPAKLVKKQAPQPDSWTMMFLDTAAPEDVSDLGLSESDRSKLLGRHKIELHGLPLAMIFVKSTLCAKSALRIRDRDKVSMSASHELAEMLVDPGNNLWCERSERTFYAYEVCDAVEEEYFLVDGIAMSDFVYPAYFDVFRKPNSTQFDHMKKIDRPFQILKQGYMPVKERGKLRLKSGSKDKGWRIKREDRRLHRIGIGRLEV
jgi:hypothetical protein